MLPTTIVLVKREGKLINNAAIDSIKYNVFLESLQEGDTVECTYEKISEDGSNAQKAKLKVCIRKLAAESGYTFKEMEEMVKRNAGLVLPDEKVKSFGKCSKEELSEAIKIVIEMGEFYSVNCH